MQSSLKWLQKCKCVYNYFSRYRLKFTNYVFTTYCSYCGLYRHILANLQDKIQIFVSDTVEQSIIKMSAAHQVRGGEGSDTGFVDFLFIDHHKRMYLPDTKVCVKHNVSSSIMSKVLCKQSMVY